MQPVERDSCTHAKDRGWEAIKLIPQGQIGLPDRQFVGPMMRTFFCEFKRPGESLSPSQHRKIKRFARLGWTIHVVDNIQVFKEIFKEYNK
jgi:hypothetical protein